MTLTERHRISVHKYEKTAKGKATRSKYEHSEKGIATRERYRATEAWDIVTHLHERKQSRKIAKALNNHARQICG